MHNSTFFVERRNTPPARVCVALLHATTLHSHLFHFFGCSTPPKRGVSVHNKFRRREEKACKRKRKEISLVFVIVMLHVLTYVVSNKLIWYWNRVVQFVSQEVWFDKGFVIWHFRNYCLLQIVSLWSLGIGVQIIFTTNELVDRIKTSNEMHPQMIKKRMFYEKNAQQAKFFMKQNAPQARLIKQNAPQAGFFDLVLMGTLSF